VGVQLTKTLTEATSISESEAADLWHHMPKSPFRTLIEYELEKRIAEETARLGSSDFSFEEYKKHQGLIEGLRVAVGILNRKGK